jgi:serine/threonine protein kinase
MIGRSVGKARILKRLGRGGMGDVYLVQHEDYDKAIAIKILPPDLTRNEELLQRFQREALSAARLDHPNLVEIYDVGEENGFHYILMAYVEGTTLQELVDDKGRLSPKEAARIALEVARGLQAVHDEGIIHRDIKPANILISSKGEVKIVDFGLAFDAEDKTTLTVAGAVMGTPWYLSPEQAEGKRADARTDLYSLGVCLYLMVCGVRPFVGETHMSVLYKQIHEKPRDPRFHQPGIPDALAELILKALEKKPDKRIPSSKEFARALDAFLKGTPPKKAIRTPLPAKARTAARPPLFSFSLACCGALLLAAVISLFFLSKRPREESVEPARFSSLFSDADQSRISGRDYGPVIQRLLERHSAEKSPAAKAAISRVGLKLSSAAKVTAHYRAIIAAEKQPALKLRDGRVSSYAFTPVPAIHADTIVEYARKSREVSGLDIVFFLLVDGEARSAIDHVVLGRDIRPECRPHLDDLVESALAQERDCREIADRLASVKDKLPASVAAKIDAARRRP